MRNILIMTCLLVAVIGLFVACTSEVAHVAPTASTAPYFASYEEALAAAEGKPILIEFYTDW
jgi:hypothetical protein